MEQIQQDLIFHSKVFSAIVLITFKLPYHIFVRIISVSIWLFEIALEVISYGYLMSAYFFMLTSIFMFIIQYGFQGSLEYMKQNF